MQLFYPQHSPPLHKNVSLDTILSLANKMVTVSTLFLDEVCFLRNLVPLAANWWKENKPTFPGKWLNFLFLIPHSFRFTFQHDSWFWLRFPTFIYIFSVVCGVLCHVLPVFIYLSHSKVNLPYHVPADSWNCLRTFSSKSRSRPTHTQLWIENLKFEEEENRCEMILWQLGAGIKLNSYIMIKCDRDLEY